MNWEIDKRWLIEFKLHPEFSRYEQDETFHEGGYDAYLTGVIFGFIAKSHELKHKIGNKFEPIRNIVEIMKPFENMIHQNMFSKKYFYFGNDEEVSIHNQESIGY